MALTLTVGILPHVRRYNPERLSYYFEQFAAINHALLERGFPEHEEPEEIEDWSVEMYGHSGLHTLRRVAAHLWAGKGVPEPAKRGPAGVPDASTDPVLGEYYDEVRSWLEAGVARYRMAYEHLILHSDDRGYYLPMRFSQVIFASPTLNVAGSMIGSAQVLIDECRQLLGALGVPPMLDYESDAVREAVNNPGRGIGWERYGIEVESCLKLMAACQRSLETGAVVVFT
ncbi:MAG TPA: hypothetical protein VK003_06245 [Oceanobacillus sp.]|nr:hypothetical protein [Oceanobacillus sp.]